MKEIAIRLWALLLCATVPVGGHVWGQEEDGADEDFRPGLLRRVDAAEGLPAVRVEPTVTVRGAGAALKQPIQWSGYLMSQNSGAYRISAHVCGRVTVRLSGRTILSVDHAQPAWATSEPLSLPFDWHPFEVDYQPGGNTDTLSLFWSGPNFGLEPIGPGQLYHDPSRSPAASFARGAELARALRCAACHRDANGSEAEPLLAAPALEQLDGHIYRDWLEQWLAMHAIERDPTPLASSGSPARRRMPLFDLGPQQRQTLLDALAAADPAAPDEVALSEQRIEQGRALLLTRGCLACHRLEQLGTDGWFSGGDLSQIAAKRPPSFFARWLAAPHELNRNHRMPLMELTAEEREAVAAFLATCGTRPPAERDVEQTSSADGAPAGVLEAAVTAAGPLLNQYRCTACHVADAAAGIRQADDSKLLFVARLQASSEWGRTCAGSVRYSATQPVYALSQQDQMALRVYYSQRDHVPLSDPQQLALQLEQRNCTACHARDEQPGLTGTLPELASAEPALAAALSALAPPSLNSVGDKLHDAALREAVQRTGPSRRPWLEVRMPRYKLDENELHRLLASLVAIDRIPAGAPTNYQQRSADVPPHVADRLVTPDGFGCTSCHAVGKIQPPKAVLNTLGPDLLMLERRIRRPWFERWVRNPARIVPRMEMPSVQTPVLGVLGEDLELQLAAVWNALNQPDFRPPAPNPVRIVRSSGLADSHERTRYVTDVTVADESKYVKPLVIGLPNRHNLLFDLQRARLAHWWLGDTARQRTLGKAWFWETGADDLVRFDGEGSELLLHTASGVVEPHRIGQFVTEFDTLRQIPNGLQLDYRLNFGAAGILVVRQQFVGVPDQNEVLRTIEVDPAALRAKDWSVELCLGAATDQLAVSADGQEVDIGDRATVAILAGDSVRWTPHGSLMLEPTDERPLRLRLAYRSHLAADVLVPVDEPAGIAQGPQPLHVVPGFDAMRLPLPPDVMPTGLAWDEQGQLIICSLKGQLLRARDASADGWADYLQVVSEDLAAPYGVATGPGYIDVINKYALLRLEDKDGDGYCELTRTLASGWGHTDDYHDWVVGLPRDAVGNYYLAFPCQQDQRSAAAARHRGSVARLIPREPTAEDPRAFEIESISTGHRFPMGIARSAAGELFVTDNQGNYNPFNELNHVIAGANYGFVNAIDRTASDPRPRLTEPVIDIPHPWTRSVNGICFLDDNDPLTTAEYGPYTGHLIGCEYDTRRLIRMSLEKVGASYQGAAYPLSRYEVEGETFLGPITCAVAPDGDIYVGCIRDSGWGGANNIGGVVRLRFQPDLLPAGIAEVRTRGNRFEIAMTRPVVHERATDLTNYHVASYRRVSTPDYGGPDVDRRTERPVRVSVAEDARTVVLEFSELREGYVYEFHLRSLVEEGQEFFPAEAHYTLRKQLPER